MTLKIIISAEVDEDQLKELLPFVTDAVGAFTEAHGIEVCDLQSGVRPQWSDSEGKAMLEGFVELKVPVPTEA